MTELRNARSNRRGGGGFTLTELLVVIVIMGALAGLLLPALAHGRRAARTTQCGSNLRQFGLAAAMYWDDHGGECFRYRGETRNNGAVYWFGWIENGAEGGRALDASAGALHPYFQGRGVEICPALNYGSAALKLKAKGAAGGYGYNLFLSSPLNRPAKKIGMASHPEGLAVFGDAAQINTWQAPASPGNPMLEEWYYLDDNAVQPNGHFRHGRKGNVVFADGHVGPEGPVPGTLDGRLPSQRVGSYRAEILRLGIIN